MKYLLAHNIIIILKTHSYHTGPTFIQKLLYYTCTIKLCKYTSAVHKYFFFLEFSEYNYYSLNTNIKI